LQSGRAKLFAGSLDPILLRSDDVGFPVKLLSTRAPWISLGTLPNIAVALHLFDLARKPIRLDAAFSPWLASYRLLQLLQHTTEFDFLPPVYRGPVRDRTALFGHRAIGLRSLSQMPVFPQLLWVS
jgi:hypothetical protein